MVININNSKDNKKVFEVNINDKRITFDSDRCIGTLLAFNDETTPEKIRDAFTNVELPDNLDLVYISDETFNGDVSEIVSIISEDYESGVDTFIVVDNINVYEPCISDILKIVRDGSVRIFIMIPESAIDVDACYVKGYELQELNNPFIIQNIIYVDDRAKRKYNTETFYANLSKKKVV